MTVKTPFRILDLSLTVDFSRSDVQRCIRSAIFTKMVPFMGTAGTKFPSRLRTCKIKYSQRLVVGGGVGAAHMHVGGLTAIYCLWRGQSTVIDYFFDCQEIFMQRIPP